MDMMRFSGAAALEAELATLKAAAGFAQERAQRLKAENERLSAEADALRRGDVAALTQVARLEDEVGRLKPRQAQAEAAQEKAALLQEINAKLQDRLDRMTEAEANAETAHDRALMRLRELENLAGAMVEEGERLKVNSERMSEEAATLRQANAAALLQLKRLQEEVERMKPQQERAEALAADNARLRAELEALRARPRTPPQAQAPPPRENGAAAPTSRPVERPAARPKGGDAFEFMKDFLKKEGGG